MGKFWKIMDIFWKWIESKVSKYINLKSVTTRWGVETSFIALILFCFALIPTLLSLGSGKMRMNIGVLITIILAIIFFFCLVSFWHYIIHTSSDEDDERKRRDAEMRAITNKLNISNKEIEDAKKEIEESIKNKEK